MIEDCVRSLMTLTHDELEGKAMTMQYPTDILLAAERALDNLLCNCSESCGGMAGVRAESIRDIARAIADERERCAKLAESYMKDVWEGSPPAVAADLPEAIRKSSD